MTARTSSAFLRTAAALALAVLVSACAGQPVSQAVTDPPEAVTSDAPASAAPSGTGPSEAPPSPAESGPPASAEPTETPEPGAPGKPTKVTFKKVGETAVSNGTRLTYRVRWEAPNGVATKFLVYGVTDCLRESKQFDGKPCVVKGMRIPKSSLKLLASVPGDLRTVDVAWKVGEAGPGPYWAVLVRASNGAGNSIFAIAWSENVCWACTY